jgi:phosphonate transport system substrate-binding protein
MKKVRLLAAALGVAASAIGASAAHAAAPAYCPKDRPVMFGVIPYDSSAGFVPLYNKLGELISEKLGCPVKVQIGTNYTAAIEAMRSGKLDLAEYGPLSYVLAHQVAGADAIATYADANNKPSTYTASIVTWPGSGITKISEVAGKTFAYSDPASTSGHLFPAYGLEKNGINQDHGVKPVYAGSHTATFEALLNHKVQAGEMNSQEVQSATVAGIYKASDFVTLWKSDPIPLDPIAVRRSVPAELKAHLTDVVSHLDLTSLTKDQDKIIGLDGHGLIPQNDAAYDGIRDLVKVLHIDLKKLSS